MKIGLEVTCKNLGAAESVIPRQLQLSHQTFNGEDCTLIHITTTSGKFFPDQILVSGISELIRCSK